LAAEYAEAGAIPVDLESSMESDLRSILRVIEANMNPDPFFKEAIEKVGLEHGCGHSEFLME
jgi:hypothetical protein